MSRPVCMIVCECMFGLCVKGSVCSCQHIMTDCLSASVCVMGTGKAHCVCVRTCVDGFLPHSNES